MSFNYNVKTYDTGWGPLMGGSTIPSLSSINVDCKCTSGGGYRATVAINFSVSINYGTQGELQHELGHLAIMKDYFSARQSYYSNTYERNYPSMAACEASQRDILNDLQKDFKSLNKLQTDQDDNLQNFWKWFQSIF
ncbi:MAG TPA: hypothetical protein VK716_14565 [Terracidiphilus sp.]|nr:hypothetical protein [Terracidiphilus sp.]